MKIRITFALLSAAILLMPGWSQTGKKDPFVTFLRNEITLHPLSDIQDIYKITYQGVFGVGHILTSRQASLEYLQREIITMPDQPDDPLIEVCSETGEMIRVNLRPFVAGGLDPEKLVDAMIESARETPTDTAFFQNAWLKIGDMIRRKILPFSLAEYHSFTRKIEDQRYPLQRHSKTYVEAYKPSYRVVKRKVFEKYFPGVK